jgi:hypothetical protein
LHTPHPAPILVFLFGSYNAGKIETATTKGLGGESIAILVDKPLLQIARFYISMNITDELERLGQLHQDGMLNDAEFALAKTRLLNDNQSGGESRSLGEAANRYVTLQMVMAGVGVILFLIFVFKVMLPGMQQTGFSGWKPSVEIQAPR